MRVTRFQYPLEKHLVAKLDLMIDRCITKKRKADALLLNEGYEGEGKTTMSVAEGYYIAEQTGRDFSHKNIFFDVPEIIKFAQENENKIIVWDEPALQALSGDTGKKIVKDLVRLLMMVRKKRHFFIFNITKFHKFTDYIIVDRPLGMVKVYSRKNVNAGRFAYIRKDNLEKLWRDWRFGKRKNYKKYSSKKVRGSFPDVLNPNYKYNVLSHFDIDEYERKKDEAIMRVGKEEESKISKTHKQNILLKYLIYTYPMGNLKEKSKHFRFAHSSICEWKDYAEKYPELKTA